MSYYPPTKLTPEQFSYVSLEILTFAARDQKPEDDDHTELSDRACDLLTHVRALHNELAVLREREQENIVEIDRLTRERNEALEDLAFVRSDYVNCDQENLTDDAKNMVIRSLRADLTRAQHRLHITQSHA